MDDELRPLLIGAAESPPDKRERFRDPIAHHGERAIAELREWVYMPELAPFALSTIVRAGELGAAMAAREALEEIARRQLDPARFAELVRAQARLETLTDAAADPEPEPSRPPRLVLERGHAYRRQQLHASLGGNRYHGISYPRNGTWALLFSGGTGHTDWGYADGPEDDGGFRYYGEWRGPGDMTLTAGNAAIIERSPNLLLFTGKGAGMWRFEGRYEHVGHEWRPISLDGRTRRAVVFRLRRVDDRFEL